MLNGKKPQTICLVWLHVGTNVYSVIQNSFRFIPLFRGEWMNESKKVNKNYVFLIEMDAFLVRNYMFGVWPMERAVSCVQKLPAYGVEFNQWAIKFHWLPSFIGMCTLKWNEKSWKGTSERVQVNERKPLNQAKWKKKREKKRTHRHKHNLKICL